MTDVLKMSRKALTMGVVLTTILWSMMATVLVAPLKASAAGCTSGSLIKGSLAAVYYCGADGKRYVFTNDKAYFTWYSNFSGVMIISDAELATIQIGGNVTYRPGVKMIKIQSDPKVYAISKNGTLRPIASEAIAACLYGSTWNKQIDDVSDAFFTNYTVGGALNACTDYDKNAEMSGSQTINQDKNLTGSPSTSGLSVSLASDTPASATVPKGATGVNFLKFNVSNGSGSSVVVDSIVLHRVGAGSPADFSNVYLYEGNTRLTTGRSVNTSTNDATFNSLNWTLAAGQTRTFWVSATMSSTAAAGNVNAFQISSLMSGTSQASGLPVQGNNMTMAGASVGSITISKSGSMVNPKVGQLAAKVAEFQLAAGATEDLDIQRITLFQSGNLSRANLTNLKLRSGGVDIASAAGVDEKDHIVFVLTQASLLERGNTRTYEVWGDVGPGARANDTILLYVEEDLDVWAKGRTYGFGASVIRTTYDGDSCAATNVGDCSATKVEGGQITLTFNGPAAHDIATNGKDQEVFNVTISSQSNVEVRHLRLAITAPGEDNDDTDDTGLKTTAHVANFTDIKVWDTQTNSVIAGPKDVLATASDSDTTQALDYTDVFTLSAGTSRTLKVTLDVANQAALDGTTVRVDLSPFQSADIRNLDNSTNVATSDIVPSSTISGNVNTVRLPSLTLSAASTPVAQTFIQGSQNIDLAGINLKAGDASDVKVSSLTVQMRVDAADGGSDMPNGCDIDGGETKFSTDILLSAKLMNGATQVGDVKSPTSSASPCVNDGGLLQFTNMNLTIAKGQTVTLLLNGNLSGSIANLNDTIDFQVTNTNVTAQDMDGNSVSVLPAGSINSADMTIAGNGVMTYALAPDDSESEAGLLLGNTTGVLAKYRFTAQNEELKLDKVRIAIPNGSATGVSSISLYDGATLVAGPTSMTTSATTSFADFSGFSFIVPKDNSKTLTVKAVLSGVGSGGAQSGLDLTVTLCNGDVSGSTCGADGNSFEVRGTSGGSSTVDTIGNSGDIAGREKRLRKTKPTLSLASLPTSTLSNGTQVISRFTVTADSAQQIALKTISFEANLNNAGGTTVSLSSPAIREVGQGSDISASTTAAILLCTGTVTCQFPMTFASEQTVTAGTSKTYELRATVSGADTAGESLSTKLLGDSTNVTGELCDAGRGVQNTFPGTVACADYNFIWSDNSAIPHTDTVESGVGAVAGADDASASNDWTNGRFLKVLPSDVQTMSR